MNPRNHVSLIGNIPESDKIRFEFKESSEESKNCCRGFLSVRRGYKKPEDKYYPSDLIPFVAFGKTAIYMDKYIHRGETVSASGEIRISDNYESNGKTIYGQPFFMIDSITKILGKSVDNEDNNNDASDPTTKKSNNPLLNRKRSVI